MIAIELLQISCKYQFPFPSYILQIIKIGISKYLWKLGFLKSSHKQTTISECYFSGFEPIH